MNMIKVMWLYSSHTPSFGYKIYHSFTALLAIQEVIVKDETTQKYIYISTSIGIGAHRAHINDLQSDRYIYFEFMVSKFTFDVWCQYIVRIWFSVFGLFLFHVYFHCQQHHKSFCNIIATCFVGLCWRAFHFFDFSFWRSF